LKINGYFGKSSKQKRVYNYKVRHFDHTKFISPIIV